MTDLCIVWEDPEEPASAPAHVTWPAPRWLKARMGEGLSLEAAIEALVVKDLPARVWNRPAGANRGYFVICRKGQIPATRRFRNAWRLKEM